jgi:hypothetical protein
MSGLWPCTAAAAASMLPMCLIARQRSPRAARSRSVESTHAERLLPQRARLEAAVACLDCPSSTGSIPSVG